MKLITGHMYGGFGGEIWSGDPRYCFNKGNIKYNGGHDGEANIGGFSGITECNCLNDCYNIGNLTINNNNKISFAVGGILGSCYGKDIKMNSCYAVGSISVKEVDTIGAIFGKTANNENTTIIINNCYSGYENLQLTGEQSEKVTITNSEIKTPEEMKQDEFIDLLNNNNEESKWKKDTNNINKGFPILYFQ